MKTKYEQFKEAVKSPPPERLAKVEYQSHFFQMIGISIVCVILIARGYWYIIFAFIFGLGISYSQGMSALIKYNNIMALLHPEKIEDYDNDVSPTRRRSKIVNHVFGDSSKWYSIVLSVFATFIVLGVDYSRITLMLIYPITILISHVVFYFFIFYWIAYPHYKKEVKVE